VGSKIACCTSETIAGLLRLLPGPVTWMSGTDSPTMQSAAVTTTFGSHSAPVQSLSSVSTYTAAAASAEPAVPPMTLGAAAWALGAVSADPATATTSAASAVVRPIMGSPIDAVARMLVDVVRSCAVSDCHPQANGAVLGLLWRYAMDGRAGVVLVLRG
jgi:hypothetical protein